MKRIPGLICFVSSLGLLSAAAQEPARPKGEHHDEHQSAADLNRRFADPDLKVDEYVRRFEADSRDVFARRRAIVRAVGVKPGQAVADIGAGTGLFTQLFAAEVGLEGKVYAVDIAPAFLKHIDADAEKAGRGDVVKTVLGSQDSANLPAGSVDVAFVCATYHHFEHPAKVLASLHEALKPGGRLVLIDFDKEAGRSEMAKHHARAAKEVYFRELAAAGFERVATPDAPKLEDNFYAEFRRVEPKPEPEVKP